MTTTALWLIHGPPGVGKSTLAKQILNLASFTIRMVSFDEEIPAWRIPSFSEEEKKGDFKSERDKVARMVNDLIKTNIAEVILVEDTFHLKGMRKEYVRMAQSAIKRNADRREYKVPEEIMKKLHDLYRRDNNDEYEVIVDTTLGKVDIQPDLLLAKSKEFGKKQREKRLIIGQKEQQSRIDRELIGQNALHQLNQTLNQCIKAHYVKHGGEKGNWSGLKEQIRKKFKQRFLLHLSQLPNDAPELSQWQVEAVTELQGLLETTSPVAYTPHHPNKDSVVTG